MFRGSSLQQVRIPLTRHRSPHPIYGHAAVRITASCRNATVLITASCGNATVLITASGGNATVWITASGGRRASRIADSIQRSRKN